MPDQNKIASALVEGFEEVNSLARLFGDDPDIRAAEQKRRNDAYWAKRRRDMDDQPNSIQIVTEMDEVTQARELIDRLLPALPQKTAQMLVEICLGLLQGSSLDVLSASDVPTSKADRLEVRVAFKVPRLLELVTAASAALDCHGPHSVAPILGWYRERIVTASSAD